MDAARAAATLRTVALDVLLRGRSGESVSVADHLDSVARLVERGAYADAYSDLVGYHSTVYAALVDHGPCLEADLVEAVERFVYEASDEPLPSPGECARLAAVIRASAP